MFNFEKLDVWHKAIDFANRVYTVTKQFPDDEKFGITSQLRRAAVSITANISEGSGRSSKKDFQHFISIAYGSTNEVMSLLIISQRQNYINNNEFKELKDELVIIARMLSGLSKSLNS